ncbi:unnamed protein product [marine sediment metagenome]|uniref:Uncharacterized protein n=1 Tax=marine sediment metagenome TaxID=412755 RepID=X1D304_9ZZZZ
MATDSEKASRKAKATRKKNVLEKAKRDEKHNRALRRAKSAEDKLKSFKEGVEFGIEAANK